MAIPATAPTVPVPGPRLNQIFLLCVCCAALFLIPLKIASYGYFPRDDALRHVAFSLGHRHWSEILVLAPQFGGDFDSHPGWHSLLRFAHESLGLQKDQLLELSFCATFWIFAFGGLLACRDPLRWMLVLSVVGLVNQGAVQRLLLGRPFAITSAVLLVLAFLWNSPRLRGWVEMVITWALLSSATWVHPTVWYIWVVVLLAFVACSDWRRLMIFGASLLAALVTVSIVVGSWKNIVLFPIELANTAIAQGSLLRSVLVGEFQPSNAPVLPLFAMATILVIRGNARVQIAAELRRPDFLLVVGFWVLGLYVSRFWHDWGIPVYTAWFFRQFAAFNIDSSKMLAAGIGFVAAVALYLGITADVADRYSSSLRLVFLNKPVEQYQALLPETGGILYSSRMELFYDLFYRLPFAKYRYITGFEPTMCRPEDLVILRNILFNHEQLESYSPWIQEMTAKDRILITSPEKPDFPGMEFSPLYGYWIGRKTVAEGDSSKAASANRP